MVSLSMINRLFCILATLFLLTGFAWAQTTVNFVYMSRISDPAYKIQKSYTGLKLKEKLPPIAGAKAAIKEAKIPGRAAGMTFELEEQMLLQDADAAEAIAKALDLNPNSIFILDLPLADVELLGARFADSENVMMLNVRHSEGELRAEKCSAAVFHTIASASMLTDAMAQYLAFMNWRKVLVLTSDSERDKSTGTTFLASAKKFGLTVVDERQFINSNDPREREKNEPRLLTGSADYDVIFLADNEGEFGRYLAYSTYLPRPVVGSEGLIASSWHWTWERNGAPQLNQRIRKVAERNPSVENWAAWAAVKSVVQAAIKTGSTTPSHLAQALRTVEFNVDLYKVGPGSYRPWDQQLRQAILLHTHNAVVGAAPFDGFLHQTNTFDTLGFDQPENRCTLRR